jgi:hypothetical protein
MDNNDPQQPQPPRTPPHTTDTENCPGAPPRVSSEKKVNENLFLDIDAEED